MKLFEHLQRLDGNQKESAGAAEPVKSTVGLRTHKSAHGIGGLIESVCG